MSDFTETLKWGWKHDKISFIGIVSVIIFMLAMIGAAIGISIDRSVNRDKGHIEYITMNDSRRIPCLYNDGLNEFISCDWDHADGADKVE